MILVPHYKVIFAWVDIVKHVPEIIAAIRLNCTIQIAIGRADSLPHFF
jgi:hypothetical protein